MSGMSTTPSHRSSRSGASSTSQSRHSARPSALAAPAGRPPSTHSYSNSRTQSRDYGGSAAPSAADVNNDEDDDDDDDNNHEGDDGGSVPVETLVDHLLAAKRSLSTMALMLRADEIARLARAEHEAAVVLAAEAEYLRRGITGQLGVLTRVRRGLNRTYDNGKRDFKALTRMMDAAGGKLQETMDMLRATVVESGFRRDVGDLQGSGSPGQSSSERLEAEDKTLMDFVDEKGVTTMVDDLKRSLKGLQSIQQSFDGDILRFETDIRNLKKAIVASAITPPSPSVSRHPISILMHSIADHSHNMADLLSSLTKHFDLCVTAVRTTDGGAALARRKAAEATTTQSQESSSGMGGGGGGGGGGVSISGVIAKQESDVSDLEPITSQDRADIIQVVLDDASEVAGVVREMEDRLAAMESEYESLAEQVGQVRAAHGTTLAGFAALGDLGQKLPHYAAAETDFLVRWEAEKSHIATRLEEMDGLRDFYGGYALAYDRLLVEVDRRRLVEERIRGIWKTAAEKVDRLVGEDRASRDLFMQDAGEFLPTDLWPGMRNGLPRWEVKLVPGSEGAGNAAAERSTPALSRSVIDAAKSRIAGSQAL